MFHILGIAICAAVLVQLGMWISTTISTRQFNRKQLESSRELFGRQLTKVVEEKHDARARSVGDWSGYREFVVDRLEKNVESVTSVYLKPVDNKPIATFKPGQHLPIQFDVPGQSKKPVRCYSLSSAPGKEHYRISVKAVAAPPNQPDVQPGLVSNFINSQLMVGDRVQAKAPSGSFYLDENANCPVILLGGGIGITPLLSMLEQLVSENSERLVVLFYGVRNSREHTFKEYLERVANKCSNFYVVNCYSNPLETDVLNRDYQVSGFVSVDLIRELLPSNNCHFYLCGPPPFMASVRNGLLDWNIPENRIRFEAFGPASIKKTVPSDHGTAQRQAANAKVVFAASGKKTTWDEGFESLLELAENRGVEIDSGCRAGSCGTCVTKLISGQVQYPEGVEPSCEGGECLACIAKPKGDVELDA